MKKLKLFIILCYVFSTNIYFINNIYCKPLSDRLIDSLLNELKNTKQDTIKINILNNLSSKLERENPKQSLIYAREAIELSDKNKYTQGFIEAYNNLGNAYFNIGEFDTSLVYYLNSEQLCRKINDEKNLAIALNNIGNVYEYQGLFNISIDYFEKCLVIEKKNKNKSGIADSYMGLGNTYKEQCDYKKSMKYFFNALEILEQLNDEKGISELYLSIGGLYKNLNNLEKSKEYFFKSLKIKENHNDKLGMAKSLNNVGIYYDDIGELDTALIFYNKSITLYGEINDKYGQSLLYNNIAGIYYKKQQIELAFDFINKSLKVREEINDKDGIAGCYLNIGFLYVSSNQTIKAIDVIEKSFEISKETGNLYKKEIASKNLSELYSQLKNYQKAYEYQYIYKEIFDSLNNKENTKHLTQLEMQYDFDKKQHQQEFEQKQKEITHLAELNRQKIVRNSFIGGFILMILLAIVIFRSYRIKKRSNILLYNQKKEIECKNEELQQQKEEITAQRDQLESLNDKLQSTNMELETSNNKLQILNREITFQKEHIEEQNQEITDSINYAKRIQEAMLPDLNSKSKSHSEFDALNLKFEAFVLFKPKDIVSGDFYWATQLTTSEHDQLLIIAVADCTGHGVPGAFMSMLGISFLNEIVRKKEVTQASHVLDQLRNSVIDALKQTGQMGEQKDGMDMSLIVINLQDSSSKLQISSSKFQENDEQLNNRTMNSKLQTSNFFHAQWAGANNPLWIVRSPKNLTGFENLSGLEEVKPDKMPIAIYEKINNFTNHDITLRAGDTVYLMSDGFQDQFGGSNCKKFLSKNLKQLIANNSKMTMNEQKIILDKTIEDWRISFETKYEQTDDITIIGIKMM